MEFVNSISKFTTITIVSITFIRYIIKYIGHTNHWRLQHNVWVTTSSFIKRLIRSLELPYTNI